MRQFQEELAPSGSGGPVDEEELDSRLLAIKRNRKTLPIAEFKVKLIPVKC